MEASRCFYAQFRIAATSGAIRSTPIEDFYLVPSEFSEGGQAVFRILINPLVWWMWASGPIMAFGAIFAMSPQRRPSPVSVRIPKGSVTA